MTAGIKGERSARNLKQSLVEKNNHSIDQCGGVGGDQGSRVTDQSNRGPRPLILSFSVLPYTAFSVAEGMRYCS